MATASGAALLVAPTETRAASVGSLPSIGAITRSTPAMSPRSRAHDSPIPDSVGSGSITGTVRSGVWGLPVAGAGIEVDYETPNGPNAHARTTWSDTAGHYVVDHIAPGTVTMRVTHPGYDTMTVQVAMAAHGLVRIDVTLAPTLVVLDSVQIEGVVSMRAPTSALDDGAEGPDTWRWQGSPATAAASTGEPDVFRVLGADPHVAVRPDGPATLRDRGGTPDQVLIRVDGLPLWSPVHSSGALAAITPDAVASVTLHDGSLPAEDGGRLAGVLDIDTRDPPAATSSGSAALGPAAARAMWTRPLALGTAVGSVLLAGRLSDGDISTMQPEAAGFRDRWADGIATAALASGPTSFRFVAVGSSDRAAPDDELAPRGSTMARPNTPWHTQTLGIIWTQRFGESAHLESRISSATFGATVPARIDSLSPMLESGVHQVEGATQLSMHNTTLGAVVDVLALQYRVTSGGLSLRPGSVVRPPLDLAGSPVLAGAFAEHTWEPLDSAWQITTGLRTSAMTGTTPRIEPRLRATLRVASGVTASAGLARSHQYIQSLRDPNSPYGAQIGLDLPAAAGMAGMPVAQSDAATVGIAAQLGRLARLTIDGYARRMSGLAVVNPARPDAFAIYGFDRASARVGGGGVELDGGVNRFTWQAAYGFGTTVETLKGDRYRPGAQMGRTASAAAAFHLDHATELRLAGWAASGQRAALVDAGPADHGDDNADDVGSAAGKAPADRIVPAGLVTTAHLPAYARADIQVRHEWRAGPGGGRLSTFVTLANAFNHDNVAAVVPGAPGVPARPIVLLPRSVLAGVSWAY